jgi:hypothetical protein
VLRLKFTAKNTQREHNSRFAKPNFPTHEARQKLGFANLQLVQLFITPVFDQMKLFNGFNKKECQKTWHS